MGRGGTCESLLKIAPPRLNCEPTEGIIATKVINEIEIERKAVRDDQMPTLRRTAYELQGQVLSGLRDSLERAVII